MSSLPSLPGFEFRHFQGDSDFPRILAVYLAANRADEVERSDTVEGITEKYANLHNSDPATDMVMVERDGRMVAYTRVMWWQEHDGPRRYVSGCFIDPAVRGFGLGQTLLEWGAERLAAIAAGHEEVDDKRLTVFHPDTQKDAEDLFLRFGLRPYLWDATMVRPHLDEVPEAPMPPGFEIRTPETEGELRKVWEADMEAFRDHPGHRDQTEDEYRRWLANEKHQQTHLWRVAWDGSEVAGQVRSFIDADENIEYSFQRGWTEFISVRKPYRRRGLARALLCQSLVRLREEGMTEAALGVVTSNPTGAFTLYQSVGFEVRRTWTNYEKPL